MTIAGEIKNKLKSRALEIFDLVDEKNKLIDELKDPDFSDSYKTSIRLRLNTIRIKIGTLQNSAQNDCKKILDQRRDELIAARHLKADEITEDAKLFNLGIVLPVEEVESIFDRNMGNRTMQRLCQIYANQHDLKMKNKAIVTDAETENINGIENTANMFIDHWIDKNNAYEMLEKFFPEEAS